MSNPGLAVVGDHETDGIQLDQLLLEADATVRDVLSECEPGGIIVPRLEHVRRIVAQLLAISSRTAASTARRSAFATSLDLNSVVQQMAPSLRRLLGPFISMETILENGGAWIAGDRAQVEQVALGLVLNARDALPLGGTVRLSTQYWVLDRQRDYRIGGLPPGTWAVVEVRDNGAWIDERAMHQMVSPLAQGPSDDLTLSLATVSSIVRNAGGQVILDGGRGSGTVLAACFPAVPAPRSRQPATGTANAILVADDDVWSRVAASSALRRAGYGVLEAEHAAGALELLGDVAGSCVRIVLVDAGLAHEGVLLTDILRRQRADLEVYTTAAPSPDPRARPAIEKPIRTEVLLRFIQERLPAMQ